MDSDNNQPADSYTFSESDSEILANDKEMLGGPEAVDPAQWQFDQTILIDPTEFELISDDPEIRYVKTRKAQGLPAMIFLIEVDHAERRIELLRVQRAG